jgi:hypothetical protein
MNMNYHRLTVCALLLGMLAAFTASPALAETKPAADKKAGAEPIEVPRSEFALPSKAGEGRDPFYPLSRRLVVETRPKTDNTPKPVAVTLTLNGVSGTESKRYALINGKTFVVGDQLEVSVGDGKVPVLCVEIREDAAIVEVNGSRQELRLKPGL